MVRKNPTPGVWHKDLNTAPKDMLLLVEHPDWECGAVVKWVSPYSDVPGFWGYVESLISDVAGGIETELENCWWTLYPKRRS